MKVTAPVTDYIPKSILTTLGDLAVRGASIPERLAGGANDLYFKGQGAGVAPIYEQLALRNAGVALGQFTKSVGTPKEVTGLGFQPSCLIVFWCDTTTSNFYFGIGWTNGTDQQCVFKNYNYAGMYHLSTKLITLMRDASNWIDGTITSFDSDGFTIGFSKANTCSVEVTWLALP